MKIYFYRDCNFRLDAVAVFDCKSSIQFFNDNRLDPDDYVIIGKDGLEHPYPYEADIIAVCPKIAKGKGKNIFTAVLGVLLTVMSGGVGAFFGVSSTLVKTLGIGLLSYGGGSLMMGKMKMPSISSTADSATKQNYQWKVGNLSTSRGVRGVTFGSNVIPEGELLAYRTYGTSELLEDKYRSERKWVKGKTKYDYGHYENYDVYDHSESVYDDTSWLELLIGCGEGELDSITDIKVNGTPIGDIADAYHEERLGANNQSSFSGNIKIDSQVGYLSIAQVMPQKLAGSDEPLIVTTPEPCDSVLIAIQCNSAYIYDTSSGNKNAVYLKPVIKYRTQGGTWHNVNTGIKQIDKTMPVKIESTYYFDIAIRFPSYGIYEISLQNCSAELNYQKGVIGGSLPAVLPDRLSCALSIDNMACYDKSEKTYPGTALIYLKIPASQSLNGGVPKVTWKQSRANIIAYNGSNYVSKPANNLAWAIYDILVKIRKDNFNNSYHVEGENVSSIDYNKFEEFATFCSGLGLLGNWFLNKLDSAWATAQSVATSARAFIGTKNGKLCPYWDAPKEMTQIFTVGNYESLSGSVSAKKDRSKAIEATFNDEADSFKSKTIRIEVDNSSVDAEATSITFVGLSTVQAVHKAAHYLLRRNKYLCQSVKFTANIDALVCELNDVIGIQCDITKYGVGGRIYAVNGNSVSLDSPVTLTGGTYQLLVAHDDGTLDRIGISQTTGTYTTLTMTSYNKLPKKGEVYSFGVVGNEVKKYRVTSIIKTSDLKCQIEATEYIEALYNEASAPDISYTNPNASINSITTTYNPESVDIAWHSDVNTAYVDVYVDGTYYGRYAQGATIPNVNNNQSIKLVPVNYYGESGTEQIRAITNNFPVPPTPPMPTVLYVTGGYTLVFEDLPLIGNLSDIVIYDGDVEVARKNVAGDTVNVYVALTGGNHQITAVLENSYGQRSLPRAITLSAPMIAGWTIDPDAIKNDDETIILRSHGESVIGSWIFGATSFHNNDNSIVLNADGNSIIGGWIVGTNKLYNNNIELVSDGIIRTMDFASGHKGWQLSQDGDAEFNNIHARGTIKTTVFEYDEVSVVGGQQMVRPGAVITSYSVDLYWQKYANTVLDDDYTVIKRIVDSSDTRESTSFSTYQEYVTYEEGLFDAAALILDDSSSTYLADITPQDCIIYVESYKGINVNDIIRIKEGISYDYWAKVTYKSSDSTGLFLALKQQHGSIFEMTKGQSLVDYGVSGSGNILFDGNSPKIDLFNHSGTPWISTNLIGRIGNLNGVDGITDTRYGFFFGNSDRSASNRHYIRYDEKSGKLQIQGEVVITGGDSYAAINTANTNANAAIAFRNAVANSNYTSINGSKITTGIIKSTNCSGGGDGVNTTAGTLFDLDNGYVSSKNFYIKSNGDVKLTGEVIITSGTTYNTLSSASTNASNAIAFRNAVANSNYTSIKGGSITTGVIKNSTYQEPSNQKFSSAGAAFDLDNGHIHTPYFYSNSSGAGFKGDIETTTGKINNINIASLIAVIESSCTTKSVTSTVGSSSATFQGVTGYSKLSNNMLVEWGIQAVTFRADSSSSGGYHPNDLVVTLPKAVSSGAYLVQLQCKASSNSAFLCNITNQTATSFTIVPFAWSNVPAAIEFLVIALGAS